MRPSSPHFFPLALPFILGFFLLLAFLVALLEVGVLGYAYEKLGIDRRYISALLMLSLLGSYVNIPIAELPAEPMAAGREVVFFGMRYVDSAWKSGYAEAVRDPDPGRAPTDA